MGGHADIIFQANPGMTGPWHVSARSTVNFAEHLEREGHYVRKWPHGATCSFSCRRRRCRFV